MDTPAPAAHQRNHAQSAMKALYPLGRSKLLSFNLSCQKKIQTWDLGAIKARRSGKPGFSSDRHLTKIEFFMNNRSEREILGIGWMKVPQIMAPGVFWEISLMTCFLSWIWTMEKLANYYLLYMFISKNAWTWMNPPSFQVSVVAHSYLTKIQQALPLHLP